MDTSILAAAPGKRTRMKWTRSLFLVAFAVFALSFNQGVTTSISNNYYKETLGLVGAQMGYLTAAREFIGFILVAVVAVTIRIPVTRLAGVSLLIAAVGYWGYGIVDGFGQLVLTAMVASLGFHTWMQVYYVLALSLAEKGYEGRVLGRLTSVGAIGTLVSMGLTWLLLGFLSYRPLFMLSAVVVALGGFAILAVRENAQMARQKGFVLKRRYWLYYVLNFLEGSRFQIFTTFALFALVESYHVDARTITLLLIVNGVANWFAAPIFGSLIDKRGERPVLTAIYVAHIFVFLGFGLVHNEYFLMGMYVLYNTFSMAGVGLNTYLKKIAEPTDVAPSLAMGVSTSHIASVAIPITGGLLWQAFGYELPFLFGTLFVILSLIFTQLLKASAFAPEPAPKVASL